MFVGSKMKYLLTHRHSLFDLIALTSGIALINTVGILVGISFLLIAGLVSVIVGRKYND